MSVAGLSPASGLLISAALRRARRELVPAGQFAPFGLSLAPDGTIGLVRPTCAGDDPRELLDSVEDRLRRQARGGQMTGTVLCTHVSAPPGSGPADGAIGMNVEIDREPPLLLMYTYRRYWRWVIFSSAPWICRGRDAVLGACK